MKYRKGFVTNSSSSSFIIAYENNQIFENELLKELEENYEHSKAIEYFDYLKHFLDRVDNQDDVEIFIESLRQNYFYLCRYDYKEELQKENRIKDVYTYIRSKQAEEEINHRVDKKLEELRNKINGCSLIKKISISDDYDILQELERIVTPNLSFCKEVFNNH